MNYSLQVSYEMAFLCESAPKGEGRLLTAQKKDNLLFAHKWEYRSILPYKNSKPVELYTEQSTEAATFVKRRGKIWP